MKEVNNNLKIDKEKNINKNLIDINEYFKDYYNNLPWYKKIITNVRWSLGDIYVKLLGIYYKNKKLKID